jgi:hypothetical protein
MFAILFNVLVTMAVALFGAGALASLSWWLLSRTRFPGLGPVVVFGILLIARNAGGFSQMLLMFSGILAVGAFATLFGRTGGKAREIIPPSFHPIL